jgi:hypothetical protein
MSDEALQVRNRTPSALGSSDSAITPASPSSLETGHFLAGFTGDRCHPA